MSLEASKDSNSPNDDSPVNSLSATHSATTIKTLSQESVSDESCTSVHGTSFSNNASTIDPKAYKFTSNYDRYIQADLENHVFMPAGDFFTNILHLPQDWHANDEVQTLIATIKNDCTFRGHVKTYMELRDKSNAKSGEKPEAFHHPHGLIFDGTFDAPGATANYRLGLNANPVVGGSQEIPNAWGVLRAMFRSSGNLLDAMQDNGFENTVSWTQTMHWQEFGPDECYLDEGSDANYSVLTRGKPLFSLDVHLSPNSHIQIAKIHGYDYDANLSCGGILGASYHPLGPTPPPTSVAQSLMMHLVSP